MSRTLPLRVGFPSLPGLVMHRSGIRWLCEDNQFCNSGKIVAYCNIRICHAGTSNLLHPAFIGEDLQLAFVLKVPGRIHISDPNSSGGFHDLLEWAYPFDPEYVFGSIECEHTDSEIGGEPLKRMFAAGRRVSDNADIRSGFLSGWHNRVRTWWPDSTDITGSLLSLGTCETTAVFRGNDFSQIQLMNDVGDTAQVVVVPDDTQVPCSRILLEQLRRTPEQLEEILNDLITTLPLASALSTSSDWFVTSLLVAGLRTSALTETTDVVNKGGVQKIAPPDAVVMSLVAEPSEVFRHRRLGYSLYFHEFTIQKTTVFKAWLRKNFEPVSRTPLDIKNDYCALIDTINMNRHAHFLIFNRITTSINENITNYSYIENPMSNIIGSVGRKELNLMLYDLAAERDVAIVDCDQIAADVGIGQNIPDGIHQSSLMQAELRHEILRLLDARSVPGFCGSNHFKSHWQQ